MYLEQINSPDDVKKLNTEELKALAAEMRKALLFILSKHGGHFGPNFGMVEATIALHYVFNSPVDKIVYDVSHQSYCHKMLTGRKEAYLYEEHFDDVSGYSNPEESEHDFFNIGHTSTSISLASGLAKARDLKGESGNVIAVIGDGSLSGGEALEGLDFAGEMDSNFIIVINDNDMSIAENHGGMYKNLKLLRKTDGKAECNLFKAMGLDYVYVGNGNDVTALISAFESVNDSKKPVAVHIVTEKGMGYELAEKNKEQWHWCMPFDTATGKSTVNFSGEDYGTITGKLVMDKIKSDNKVCAITFATPAVFGFTADKRKEAGKQFIDVGIAEEQAAAMASGIAKNGGKPFYGVYSTFIQRTYDQLSQDICINNNPVAIAVFAASVYGMNDVTHLGIPVAVRVPAAVVSDGKKVTKDFSKLNVYEMTQKGSKVAVIALGSFYGLGEQTAKEIESRTGVKPTLINPYYITGVDTEMLESLKADHSVVITLEDGVLDGGFGEKIARFYGSSDVKVLNYGLKKDFLDRYDAADVMKENRLTPELIAEDTAALL